MQFSLILHLRSIVIMPTAHFTCSLWCSLTLRAHSLSHSAQIYSIRDDFHVILLRIDYYSSIVSFHHISYHWKEKWTILFIYLFVHVLCTYFFILRMWVCVHFSISPFSYTHSCSEPHLYSMFLNFIFFHFLIWFLFLGNVS